MYATRSSESVLDRIPRPRSRCRSGVRQNAPQLVARSQCWQDLSAPFFGANRPGSTVSQGPAVQPRPRRVHQSL